MGDKDRATDGNINLSLDEYHEGFLKDHPEINASAVFRGTLDELIYKMGWSPDSSDEDWTPDTICRNTTEDTSCEAQATAQDDD